MSRPPSGAIGLSEVNAKASEADSQRKRISILHSPGILVSLLPTPVSAALPCRWEDKRVCIAREISRCVDEAFINRGKATLGVKEKVTRT